MIIIALAAMTVSFAEGKRKPKKTEMTISDSVFYSLAVDIISMIDNMGNDFDMNWDYLIKAVEDHRSVGLLWEREEAAEILRDYFMVRLPQLRMEGAENFLDSVKRSTPGIRELADGKILYVIYNEGSDQKPFNDTDKILVNYTATLADGTVFDSSYERGEPAEFTLDRVIRGWTESLKLIGEGGMMRIWIHPDYGYGARAQGNSIPVNAALVFDVELLEVNPSDWK